MATVTLRIPSDKHVRLKRLAKRQGLSLNKLLEELTTAALVEEDVETRYRARAARGVPERGLELLEKLDGATEG